MSCTQVAQWLTQHTSLEPSLLHGAGFEAIVAERMAATFSRESEYLDRLEQSPDEVDRLTAGIAVPETWLFRYPNSYRLLADHLRRRRECGADSIRMCSIGCATGQEPYCMAMTALHAGWSPDQVRIIAVDRHREFLRVAEVAEYGPGSARGEIPDWAIRFLLRRGDQLLISPAVRCMVQFQHADATAQAALADLGRCDVIFCRNVMIYLNAASRARLLAAICEALPIGGLLFVGHAEQVIPGPSLLRPVAEPHAFALKRVAVNSPVVTEAPARAGTSRHAMVQHRAPAPMVDQRRPVDLPVESVVASLDDARDLADAGRLAEAETMIDSIVTRRGPSAAALELLGMIRMASNDSGKAKRLFEQAVYLEPSRSTSLLQLAILTERSGDSQRAAVLWDRARRAAEVVDTEARP